MVTVVIISFLVAGALPAFVKMKRRSAATAIANDLRMFTAAYEAYAAENGTWPAETDAGTLPPEMASRIHSDSWLRLTPIGGQYNWDNNQMHSGTRYRAAIAISSSGVGTVTQDADMFLAIDQAVDDGNLSTGTFRIGADSEPVYIVAQ